MNFKIKEELKPIDDLSEEEAESMPASYGFWYSLGEGDSRMFVELLEDEETKKKCYEAINILNKLECAVEDYVIWM